MKHNLKSQDNRDIYRKLKLKKIGITEPLFSNILLSYSKYLTAQLFKDITVYIKYIGTVKIMGFKTKIDIVNGKIKTNRKVDWKTTIEMWAKYPETKLQKKVVYYKDEIVFKIFLDKKSSRVKTASYLEFVPSKHLKSIVSKALKEGKITGLINE